ncbi:hypothetical protein K8R04_05235, partial [Candidatus Uhrbacteria bacterium]|nr:hypothetical protein [Candidatus Uhrbacteria bacterium]
GIVVFFVMAYCTYLSVVSDFFVHLSWWDDPIHILGGAWAGLIAAWFLIRAGKMPTMAQCIGFALFCGVAVEIFEYYSGIGRSLFMSYPLDTAKDFVMDIIGGYLAWRYVRFLQKV